VDIAAADSAGLDADEEIVWAEIRGRHFGDLKLFWGDEEQSFHANPLGRIYMRK
jgi:hypothetical protein